MYVCVCVRGNQLESCPLGVDVRIALHAEDASATDALLRCYGPKRCIFHSYSEWVCGDEAVLLPL